MPAVTATHDIGLRVINPLVSHQYRVTHFDDGAAHITYPDEQGAMTLLLPPGLKAALRGALDADQ